MDKNSQDKFIFLMVVGIFILAIYVSMSIVKHIHDVSFNMGVLVEKVEKMEGFK